MFKPIATIRSTPRLLPEAREEIYKLDPALIERLASAIDNHHWPRA